MSQPPQISLGRLLLIVTIASLLCALLAGLIRAQADPQGGRFGMLLLLVAALPLILLLLTALLRRGRRPTRRR